MYIRELTPKYKKKRIPDGTLPESFMDSPAKAGAFFVKLLGDEPVERMVALYLDMKMRPISFQYLAHGTVDQAAVYPGEIAKGALLANASGIVIAHNHPSGSLEFSPQDLALTKRVEVALKTVGLKLQDHILVGESETVSWKELY